MAIQYVGGNTGVWVGSTGTNNTVSLTALTGGIATAAAIGDVVIAVYSSGSTANRTLAITTGYTTISAKLYANGSTADTNLLVTYKKLTAADTTVTFGPTGSTADAGAAAVYVFRGVASSIFDVTTTTATGTGTGRPTPPAITPVSSGTVIVCIGAGAAGAGAVYTTATLTSFRTVTSPDTNDAMLGIGRFAWTSGTYTPAQFGGGTVGGGDSWAAMSIALREFRTPINTTILESNSTLGDAMDSVAATANNTVVPFNLDNTNANGNAFIAPTTGQLGNIKFNVESVGTGTAPTTQGAIELWQLASNVISATPTTLIASMPIPYITTTYATSGASSVEFNLSNTSAMTVTAGTGYAIMIRSGSGWSNSTGSKAWTIQAYQPTTVIYPAWVESSGFITASTYTVGIELDYLNATLDSEVATEVNPVAITESATATNTQDAAGAEQVVESVTATDAETAVEINLANITETGSATETETAQADFISSITETVTSTETEDASIPLTPALITETGTATDTENAINLLGAAITETGTATETETAVDQANAWILENTVNGPFTYGIIGNTTSGGFSGANASFGIRFIANQTTQLGIVTIECFYSGSVPTVQPARVTIWQLASNSLTALPSTNLGEITFDLTTTLKTTLTLTNFDFTSLNITLTSGVGYAVTISNPSDSSSSTSFVGYARVESNVPPANAYNYYRALYSNISGTYPSTYSANTAAFKLNVQPVQNTAATQTGGFVASSTITETGTATESENAVISYWKSLTESTPTLGNALDPSFVSYALGASGINNSSGLGTGFIASQTGHLGKIAFDANIIGSVNPSTNGAIELWQLASNVYNATPTTLLATYPFNINDVSVSGTFRYTFDLSSTAGFSVTTGTGYAITIRSGSDWNFATTKTISLPFLGKLTSLGSYITTFYWPWFESSSASFSAHIGVVPILLDYLNATLDSELATYSPSAAITETGTATESETAVDQANAWILENTVSVNGGFTNVIGLMNSFTSNFLGQDNESVGIRFIANQSAVIGNITIPLGKQNGTSVPTQPVKITLWQLASNSLTALPSINLAEITFSLTSLNLNALRNEVYDFSSFNITLTVGVGYAITVTAPSDLNSSGGYRVLFGVLSGGISSINPINYYKSIYSDMYGTYPSTYLSGAGGVIINAQPVQATAATQTGSLIASSAITETVTSTETEDAGFVAGAVITETVTSTETEDASIPLTPALITETVTSTETETAVNTANALITETGTANGTQTAINLATAAITESAPATETETAIYTPNADITESAPATDTENGGFVALSNITETVTTTETEAAVLSKDTVITETSPATETELATYTTNSAITESAPATETQTGGFIAVSVITESGAATEYQINTLITTADITETIAATDTQDSLISYNGFITEVANAVVISVVYANFVVSITETVNATDSYFARGWFIIPDGQTPDWNPINDTQGAVWAAVNDTQTNAWVVVNDAQTVTWNTINDGQNPGWVDVDDSQ